MKGAGRREREVEKGERGKGEKGVWLKEERGKMETNEDEK